MSPSPMLSAADRETIRQRLQQEHDQLEPAWRYITEQMKPGDLRGPIDVTVPAQTEAEVQRFVDAVAFFTATEATIERMTPDFVRLTSIGYRAGPAGDH